MKNSITYVFGRKSNPEFPSPCNPFIFTVSTSGKPSTWESAYALLGYFRDEFIAACSKAETSSALFALLEDEVWIPSCYLDMPTVEVNGVELLLNGERPNPWLSLKKPS
jgi:hypothetical protein